MNEGKARNKPDMNSLSKNMLFAGLNGNGNRIIKTYKSLWEYLCIQEEKEKKNNNNNKEENHKQAQVYRYNCWSSCFP